jgi:tetratricopeptide (TPR) repeat protein
VTAPGNPLLALEFHPAAVAALDAFFDLNWGEHGEAPGDETWRPSTGKWNVIVSFGCFFGELLRREFGGTWERDEGQLDNTLAAHVALPGGVQAFALSYAYKRLRDGPTNRFEAYYLQVRAHFKKKPQADECDGWLRQGRHSEGIGRPDLARGFYERALALELEPEKRQEVEAIVALMAEAALREEREAAAQTLEASRARLGEWAAQAESALTAFGARPAPGSLPLACLEAFMDDSVGAEPLGPEQQAPHAELEQSLGAWVGELLRTRFRGAWREDSEQPPEQWTITWPSGASVSPFALVTMRLAGGADASVQQQLAAVVARLVQAGEATASVEDPKDWLAQASAFTARGRLDLALRFGAAALEHGGDAPPARLRLARWCRELGRMEEALQQLEAGLKLDPLNGELRRERAEIELALVQAAQARNYAKRLAELGDSADGHLMRAASHFSKSEPQPALAAFERALELDPARSAALLGKARALLALERFAEAATWLGDFEGRADCEPERSYLAAGAALALGEKRKAHALFAGVASSPRLTPASRELAQKRVAELADDPEVRRGDPERAASPADAVGDDHEAVALARAGRETDAIVSIERYLADKSGSQDGRVLAARRLLFELRNPGRVPDRAASDELLGRAEGQLAAGGPVQALPAFEDAVHADPLNGEAWLARGGCLVQLSRPEDALVCYREAETLLGPRADLTPALAATLLRLGRGAEAVESYDRALAVFPRHAELELGKARLLVRLSRTAEALPIYARAVARRPADAALVRERADALGAAGRAREALAAYETALELAPGDTVAQQARLALVAALSSERA